MKQFTPFKRIDKYAFDEHRFATPNDFRAWLRKGNSAPDYVVLDNLLYTMHEFDEKGEDITYFNERIKYIIQVSTTNRYKNGFTDAEVITYPAWSWRNDIVYAD